MTRICYVEDERDIAGVVSEYLEERGFQVSLCAGAQDAREALGKEGWLFAAGYVTDGPGFP